MANYSAHYKHSTNAKVTDLNILFSNAGTSRVLTKLSTLATTISLRFNLFCAQNLHWNQYFKFACQFRFGCNQIHDEWMVFGYWLIFKIKLRQCYAFLWKSILSIVLRAHAQRKNLTDNIEGTNLADWKGMCVRYVHCFGVYVVYVTVYIMRLSDAAVAAAAAACFSVYFENK